MAIQLNWYARGRVVSVEQVDETATDDLLTLDFGLNLYLDVSPNAKVHFILDHGIAPYVHLLSCLDHPKCGWVVIGDEHSAAPYKGQDGMRYQVTPRSQDALGFLKSVDESLTAAV